MILQNVYCKKSGNLSKIFCRFNEISLIYHQLNELSLLGLKFELSLLLGVCQFALKDLITKMFWLLLPSINYCSQNMKCIQLFAVILGTHFSSTQKYVKSYLLKDAVTFFHLANSHCNIFLLKMVFSFHFRGWNSITLWIQYSSKNEKTFLLQCWFK